MKTDFDTATQRTFDVCVVGSGPAGIICALELSRVRPEVSILLVEYGMGDKSDAGTNSLDEAISIENPINHHPPCECTNKGLGGSSISWGGRCVMYDEVDFIPRAPFARHCTWSVELFREINALADPVSDYFECVRGPYHLHGQADIGYRPITQGFKEGEVTDSCIEKWSLPTRFGAKFSKELHTSRQVHLLSACEARTIPTPDPQGCIESIVVCSRSDGRLGEVNAKTFVLAAGAQETTRLLLKSKSIFERRGGVPDSLGKYYQGHISGKIATVRFNGDPKLTDHGFLRSPSGEYVRRRFQFPTDVLVSKGIMNTALWLDNPLYFDPVHRSGPMSFMYLAMITPVLGRRLAPPAVAYSITKGKRYRIGAHLANLVRDFPKSFWVPASIFFRRYCLRRKLPGVFLPSDQNCYALHFHAEQEPTEENRMELAADGKTLRLFYGYTDYDAESVIKAHDLLDSWLRRCGCGKLEYWYPRDQLVDKIKELSRDGVHQVGTTRLSERAADGVVDTNLKVWGTKNLYICSSSVFPTSGQANPTFMLGVFALRLARFLDQNALR